MEIFGTQNITHKVFFKNWTVNIKSITPWQYLVESSSSSSPPKDSDKSIAAFRAPHLSVPEFHKFTPNATLLPSSRDESHIHVPPLLHPSVPDNHSLHFTPTTSTYSRFCHSLPDPAPVRLRHDIRTFSFFSFFVFVWNLWVCSGVGGVRVLEWRRKGFWLLH